MPWEERFQHAPVRGVLLALPSQRNLPFRSGQQPKLRKVFAHVVMT